MSYYLSLIALSTLDFGPMLGPFRSITMKVDGSIIVTWQGKQAVQVPSLLGIVHEGKLKLNTVVVSQIPAEMIQRQPGAAQCTEAFCDVFWEMFTVTCGLPVSHMDLINAAFVVSPVPPIASLQVSAAPTPTGVLMPDPRGLAQDLIRLARKLGYQYEHGDWVPLSQITANEAGYGKIDAELTKREAARFDDYVITEAFGKWLKANRTELYDVLAGAHGGRITSADAYIRQEGQDWLLVWSGPWRRAPVPIKYCYWHNQDHFDNAIGMVLKSHPDKLTA